jgi:hypothetical protein
VPSYTIVVKKELFYFLSCIGVGVVVGLVSAALINREIEFFFYSALLGTVLSGIGCLIALLLSQFFQKSTFPNIEGRLVTQVLAILLSSTICFSFLTLVPLNIDRSFSVWMLNEISRNEQISSLKQIEEKAQNFFTPGSGEIRRRVNEQIRLGNIKVTDEKIGLSKRGESQTKFHRLIRFIFALNEKYTE